MDANDHFPGSDSTLQRSTKLFIVLEPACGMHATSSVSAVNVQPLGPFRQITARNRMFGYRKLTQKRLRLPAHEY